jgi:hypothetical protein
VTLYRGRLENDPKTKCMKMSMKRDDQHGRTEIVSLGCRLGLHPETLGFSALAPPKGVGEVARKSGV